MHHFKGTARIGDYEGGGRIPVYFRKLIHECLTKLPNDSMVEFVIKPRKRTKNQNDFYWGVAVPVVQSIFSEAGQVLSAGEAHEIIFGVIAHQTRVVLMPDGSAKEVRRSSTDLTTVQWEDSITLLRAWCAQQGKNLPSPNEGGI